MSYRLASLRVVLTLAGLAAVGAWSWTVQAGSKEPGRSIQFSEARSNDVTTNLHQLTSKKDSLKQLEDDLNKSFRTFSGASSLDGVAPPPPDPPSTAPVIPSKRLKERLERRKNLFLLTPEDLVDTPTLEEMLKVPEYGPDGLEKRPKSPLELNYERLNAKRAGSLKPIRFHDDETSDPSDVLSRRETPMASDDLGLPSALREKEETLKKLSEPDSAGNPFAQPPPKRNSFSDIFGLGEATPSREKALEHKKYMEEFSAIFETSRPRPASAETPNPLGASTESQSRWANPFGTPDGSTGVNGALGSVNPVFTPSGPLDVNAQALGQPSPTPLTPKTDVSKPVTPTFTAPRRPF
jgi:hypothetical protein